MSAGACVGEKRERSDGAPTSRYGPILEARAVRGSCACGDLLHHHAHRGCHALLAWKPERARGVSAGTSRHAPRKKRSMAVSPTGDSRPKSGH